MHTCVAITAKRMPHAIPTRIRASTITQHANWLTRFKNMNTLAMNHPHDHTASMKSHWALHCSHIRRPSSMNVLTRHRRATGKRTCLPCRSTYSTTKTHLHPAAVYTFWKHSSGHTTFNSYRVGQKIGLFLTVNNSGSKMTYRRRLQHCAIYQIAWFLHQTRLLSIFYIYK